MTELGYEPVLFQYPAEAITWLLQEKPDFVCTDLNMPEITGIELIIKVRQKYSRKELPIIMVTTQSEIKDNKTAWEAGVSEVMNKPFDKASVAAVFQKVTVAGE